MISFGQILILVLLAILLFGDSRHIFNRIILFFVNFKTLARKVSMSETKKKDKDVDDSNLK